MKNKLLFLIVISFGNYVDYVEASGLPMLQWNDQNFEYIGAFLLPSGKQGDGEFNNSGGAIALSESAETLFVQGKKVMNTDSGVAEVQIPVLVNSLILQDLNTAQVVQPFVKLMTKSSTGNVQQNDEYRGLFAYQNSLIASTMKIYDGLGSNTDFLLNVSDASNLSGSLIKGFMGIDGNAKASGWISAVPIEWQSVLGCKHIIGNSSGFSINSRLSMGPSAYCIDLDTILAAKDGETISTSPLMVYPFSNQLQKNVNVNWNLSNTVDEILKLPFIAQNNDIWTFESRAGYGFIVPGTRTYAVFGKSGGHVSGVGYKITQDDGNLCGGYCSKDPDDWSNYVWFFDVDDFAKVIAGELSVDALKPYSYGPISTPFDGNGLAAEISGGAYDAEKGVLYLLQTNVYVEGYNQLPAILAYKINVPPPNLPMSPLLILTD